MNDYGGFRFIMKNVSIRCRCQMMRSSSWSVMSVMSMMSTMDFVIEDGFVMNRFRRWWTISTVMLMVMMRLRRWGRRRTITR